MMRRGSSLQMPALALLFLVVCKHAAASGPVYVNPEVAPSSSAAPASSSTGGDLVTQTVYGFLDFTTTIGNTVMIFSPQSAPAAPEPAKKASAPKAAPIETKPSPATTTPPPSAINPSKTVPASSEKKQVEKKSSLDKKVVSISSVVEVRVSSAVAPQPPQPIVSSKVEVRESTQVVVNLAPSSSLPTPPFLSSVVEVRTSGGDSSDNLLSPPEVYDFLSKQPQEVVDETYRVYDLKGPSSKVVEENAHPHRIHKAQPTGVITTMIGTVVREGLTTVHETKVVGTFVSGKYTQVLQSTSTIKSGPLAGSPAIRPSASLRILKTAAPLIHQHNKIHLDPTPAGAAYVEETAYSPDEDQELNTKPLRRSANIRSDFLTRLHRSKSVSLIDDDVDYDVESSPKFSSTKRPVKSRAPQTVRPTSSNRFANTRFGRTSTSELATVSVFSGEPRTYSTASVAAPNRFKSYRNRAAAASSSSSTRTNPVTEPSSYTRRGYKPRANNNPEGIINPAPSSAPPTINKFKLNRPAGRWQYKTSPKPRVTIRQQQNAPVKATTDSDLNQDDLETINGLTASHAALTSPTPGGGSVLQNHYDESGVTEASSELQAEGAEVLHVQQPAPAQETIKVEISTPADFSDVYFEIATIKSPYTFQVGTVKNTRFITVTSTFERSLVTPTESPDILPTEPLTENILATSTPAYDAKELPVDASIATLPPIVLATNVETPPLETITETFNTTQLMLKTHILPVIQQGGTDTKLYTLVQSYHVTRFVTAIKTLPPAEAFQFLPSRALNEFNTRLDEAGSELHELEVSENDQESEGEERRLLPPDLDLAQIGGDFDLDRLPQRAVTPNLPVAVATTPEPPTTPSTPQLSPEQLQQLAILRYLNPLAPIPAITSSKPVVRLETIYESHVIPLFNGHNTVFTTISRPVSTVAKTEYEVTTIAGNNGLLPQQQQQQPLQQQQFTISSQPVVTQTVVTQTNSKVVKLNFGAKTVFTTLYSTKVVPTLLTTYITTQVPVQPTAAPFPGFFPGAFPGGFPFVG